MTAYRWHIVDPIPFKKSLRLDIEHNGWTFNADGSRASRRYGSATDLMSSVAFWYQEGVATDAGPCPTAPRACRRATRSSSRSRRSSTR